jgi:hypothetical protein
MRTIVLCYRVLGALGAGTAAFLAAFKMFAFVAIALLDKEVGSIRFAQLEGTVGFSFAALCAVLSAYFVFQKLRSRSPHSL